MAEASMGGSQHHPYIQTMKANGIKQRHRLLPRDGRAKSGHDLIATTVPKIALFY